MNTKEIQEAALKGNLTPHLVAEYRVRLSGFYAADSERMARLLAKRPVIWKEIRSSEGCKSDKQADREYEATEDGIEVMKLKLKMVSMEKLMSALRSQLEVMSAESRNLM